MKKVSVFLEKAFGGVPGSDYKVKLYPFRRVSFELQRDRICPFCGDKAEKSFGCCQEWKDHLARLQEFYGDNEHQSCLNSEMSARPISNAVPIERLTINALKRREVVALGSDFWDDAKRYDDEFTDKSYWVSKGCYDGEHVEFYYKDLINKSVYVCKADIKLQMVPINMVKLEKQLISGGSYKIGNYHEVTKPRTIATFKDWADFCQALKQA